MIRIIIRKQRRWVGKSRCVGNFEEEQTANPVSVLDPLLVMHRHRTPDCTPVSVVELRHSPRHSRVGAVTLPQSAELGTEDIRHVCLGLRSHSSGDIQRSAEDNDEATIVVVHSRKEELCSAMTSWVTYRTEMDVASRESVVGDLQLDQQHSM